MHFSGPKLFGNRSVGNTVELHRIRNLPRRQWSAAELDRFAIELTNLLKKPAGTQRLRQLQAQALLELSEHGGLFGPIGVGEGKTLITLLAATVANARRPMLLLPAGLVRKTEEDRREYAKHWKVSGITRIASYEQLGRVSGARDIELWKPDLIIADECFVAGTRIRTPKGLRCIEDIEIGDKVWAFDGASFTEETVLDAWSSMTDETYELEIDGHVYETTANHPFLTEEGWRNASDCKVGDRVLCDVRASFRGDGLQKAQILRSCLQAKQSGDASESVCADVESIGPRSHVEEAYVREQSKPKPGVLSESQNQQAGSRQLEASGAGRERKRLDTSASEAVGGSGGAVGCGETDTVGRVSNSCLSDRHLPRTPENRCGGGRAFAQGLESESAGRAQAGVPGGTRLACITRVERIDRSAPERRCRVHNLHVTGPSTYVLETGVVVHNCHRLKNKKAAVTRRVVRYMREHPETRFMALSGTMMRKSIKDFAHILRWCLKAGAPIPVSEGELEEWADALDDKVNPFQRPKPGALISLSSSVTVDSELERARKAFRDRLVRTPGVVASSSEKIGTSLLIKAVQYDVSPVTEKHFETLRTLWQTPDGWDLMEAVDVWRHARELAIGFHSVWSPRPPQEWLAARREWFAFVRETLSDSRTLDSPKQVQDEVIAGRLKDGGALRAWKLIEKSFIPNPKDVWHDETALDLAAKWLEDGPGIVWTKHRFFGLELARRTGVTYYGEEGLAPGTGAFIMNHDPRKPLIASADANGTGKNLQFMSRNLITCPVGSAMDWEQLLGRTHRSGQEADEVTAEVLVGCSEHLEAWESALSEARAGTDLLGHEQRLLYADKYFVCEKGVGFRWKKSRQRESNT